MDDEIIKIIKKGEKYHVLKSSFHGLVPILITTNLNNAMILMDYFNVQSTQK